MKNKLYWLLILALCLTAVGGAPQKVSAQRESPPQSTADVPYVPGQMIVVYRQGLERGIRLELSQGIAEAMSGNVLEVRGNAALLGVDENLDIQAFTADFHKNIQTFMPDGDSRLKNIAYVQPNFIYGVIEPVDPGEGSGGNVNPPVPRPNGDDSSEEEEEVQEEVTEQLKQQKSTPVLPTYPQDPFLFESWGWWDTNSDVVWQERATSPMVCVLDTGVDAAHPDLAGRVVNGRDVVNNDAIPDDDNGHGTHVAGIIAAKQNNKEGIAGISKSKILAIKALDYSGQGDSWDINLGIRLCANNSSVKIINMSFGSVIPVPYPNVDDYLYQALEYAIVTKGKLAVAAAGNSSTSYYTFPAAWAGDFVCRDGWLYTPPADCRNDIVAPNTISDGLISVAAGRSYWSTDFDGFSGGTLDGYLWVDTNGNNIEDEGAFYMPWCAAWFSNYGAWVSIAAPGENILSTVPVSYPFHQQYRLNADPDGDGYDAWSGTSMAAPHVAGVAARVWSIGNSLFGMAPTNTLVKERLVNTGYEVPTAIDANMNPAAEGYYSSYNGEAPYCWPNANFGPFHDMTGTRFLNAAEAMNRTTVYAYIYNALNALPLKGTTLGAYLGDTPKSQAFMGTNFSPMAILPNLQRGKTYDIKVNKTGFTDGPVLLTQLTVPQDYAYIAPPELSVSIPPMGNIHGVIDWIIYNPGTSDLDLSGWLPDARGLVSYGNPGRLSDYPYARWNRDGGFGSEFTPYYDWAATESVSIKPRPGYPTLPYFNTNNTRQYDFLVRQYFAGPLNNNDVYFRLWVQGQIKATVHKDAICGPGENWWKAGYMRKDTFVEVDSCGNDNLFPYPFDYAGDPDNPFLPSSQPNTFWKPLP